MTEGMGVVLQNHLSSSLENQRQTSQPTYHPPDQTWRDHWLMVVTLSFGCIGGLPGLELARTRLDGITDQTASVPHHGAIGGVMLIQVLPGQRQQTRRRETLIRQDESQGGR